MTCDVIASTLATHALYSKVSMHEAPEALHDMAFTYKITIFDADADADARCQMPAGTRNQGVGVGDWRLGGGYDEYS